MPAPAAPAGPADRLVIDAPTRASLELLRSLAASGKASLLAAIDRTVTGPGARELAARLPGPCAMPQAIAARLDAVAFLRENETLREDLRAPAAHSPDIARAMSRLALQRGGPRDLAAVRDGLAAASACAEPAAHAARGGIGLPDALAAHRAAADGMRGRAASRCSRAPSSTMPPHLRRDGGFVRAGYRADLDAARALRDDSRKVMAALEAKYVDETGIKSLKVRHNNILGYYIEVPAGAAKPLLSAPLSATFRHRQTMAGAVRFTTPELVETESRIVSAAERALTMEQDIFAELAAAVAAEERALGEVAAALAELDCEAALAELAVEQGYTRPVARRQHRLRDPRRPPSRGRAGAASRQGRRLHRATTACSRPRAPTRRPASTR